jgi:Sensors of blue-light using FAD
MYERIIYVSCATPQLGMRDVYDIIRVAHNRNSRHGLTGALLFLDGHFLQVIEGDPWSLRARYEAIAADTRHLNLQLREQAATPKPSFPNEWMALRHGDAVSPQLRRQFGYTPGFGAEAMSPAALLGFAQACLQASAAPG